MQNRSTEVVLQMSTSPKRQWASMGQNAWDPTKCLIQKCPAGFNVHVHDCMMLTIYVSSGFPVSILCTVFVNRGSSLKKLHVQWYS